MPVYTYRRDDGTTFDYRQKFSDDALTVDPVTGQHVVRVVQPAGVIFKGSGFYVNDSKSASRSSVNNTANHSSSSETKSEKSDASAPVAEKKPEAKTETPAAKPAASSAAD
jgi:predicted nucleic acid-binding Zn ribbon protein